MLYSVCVSVIIWLLQTISRKWSVSSEVSHWSKWSLGSQQNNEIAHLPLDLIVMNTCRHVNFSRRQRHQTGTSSHFTDISETSNYTQLVPTLYQTVKIKNPFPTWITAIYMYCKTENICLHGTSEKLTNNTEDSQSYWGHQKLWVWMLVHQTWSWTGRGGQQLKDSRKNPVAKSYFIWSL